MITCINTIKNRSTAVGITILLAWVCALCARAESNDRDARIAVVLMVQGRQASFTADGSKPQELKVGQMLPPGSVVITGKKTEAVIFFRQIGTMVRLRSQSTLTLEKMTKYLKDGLLLKETVLNLQAGELMCVVRVLVEESKFAVKIPGYIASFYGAGVGRYDIQARGKILVGKKSENTLKVATMDAPTKICLLQPGQSLDPKNMKAEAADQQSLSVLTREFDELHALAVGLTPPPRPEELPRQVDLRPGPDR